MTLQRDYEMMILLTNEFTKNELKSWVLNYARNLRKFNVSNISVISRGKHNLNYSIFGKTKGNYIQFNFSSTPKYITHFLITLKFDSHVLRYLVFNRQERLIKN